MSNLHSFVFGPFQENTYILSDAEKNCWIVDPGCYTDTEKQLLKKYLEDQQLKPVKLINTHGHLDHVFGNKFVFDTYGLIPVIHPLEKEVFDYAPVAGLMYDVPFDHYEGEVSFIEEGNKLVLGEQEFQVIHTPGHSPGSISLYNRQSSVLISGDVLFEGSIGRTDLPGGNFETLISSIKTKLLVLPDETVVYSGHGPATTIGAEKTQNPYLS
jgi:glyoxylase-like metal-dependent hydrolase (beta-lactamase superfamily II)